MPHEEHSECQSLLASLCDYVDGTLGQQLCQEIDRHLAECPDCTVMVDTLRKTITLVHKDREECAECPEQVRERLYKTLNLEDYLKRE